MFVVLNHVTSGKHPYCKCLKITSHTQLYEGSPEELASCVMYEADAITFLPKKSAVQPENDFNIAHEQFERYAKTPDFKIMGTMPADFHEKLVSAIRASSRLNTKQKTDLLHAIGEPLEPTSICGN